MHHKQTLFLWTLAAVFFVGVILLYFPGLHGPFLLDDLQSIEPAKISTFSLHNLLEVSLNNDSGPLGRPLSIASFALNHYFWGPAPFSYKAVNLGLHMACSLALGYFIYLLILLQPRRKHFAMPVAMLTAILWLIHPLQASTLLYPVQRMTQLATLFTLIGLWTYLLARIRFITLKPFAGLLMAISLLWWFPLAVLSKETGILFPWYLLCCEFFVLRFQNRHGAGKTKLKILHLLFSGGVLLGAIAYFFYKLPYFLAVYTEKSFTLTQRVLTETKALVFYIKLILLPRVSDMGLYHDDFAISRTFDLPVLLSTLTLASCIMLILFLRKRAPIIAFGLAWFFVSHAIESTVLPLELVFEHRNYLASAGLLLIPCYYFVLFFQQAHTPWKQICGFFMVVLIITLGSLSHYRAKVFSSNIAFLSDAQAFHPLSARLHIEKANWYLQQEYYQQASLELDYAQSLEPNNAGIALQKLLIYCRSNGAPKELYENALSKIQTGAITPYVIVVLDTMIQNMFRQQCAGINQQKIMHLIQAAYQNPLLAHKPLYKAVLYHLEAGLHMLQKDVRQTRVLLEKSYDVYPKRMDPLIQKAYIEMQHGLMVDAQHTVNKVHHNASYLRPSRTDMLLLDKTLKSINSGGGKE
jgi:Tfp pilus assembly protein PilF